jgi:hypothetical protein
VTEKIKEKMVEQQIKPIPESENSDTKMLISMTKGQSRKRMQSDRN